MAISVAETSIIEVVGSSASKIAGGTLNLSSNPNSSRSALVSLPPFELALDPLAAVLQSSSTTFVFAAGAGGVRHFIVSFGAKAPAADVARFRAAIADLCTLRAGSSFADARAAPSSPAAAAGDGGGGGGAAPAPSSAAAAASLDGASLALAARPAAEAADEPRSLLRTVSAHVATGVTIAGKSIASALVTGADYAGAGVQM